MSDSPMHDKAAAIPDEVREAVMAFVDGPLVVARWGCPHGAVERFDPDDPLTIDGETRAYCHRCAAVLSDGQRSMTSNPWKCNQVFHGDEDKERRWVEYDPPKVLDGTEDGWACRSRACRMGEQGESRLWPVSLTPARLMHEILGIDYEAYMDEKDEALRAVRELTNG